MTASNLPKALVFARRVGNGHGSHFEWRGHEKILFEPTLLGACAAFFVRQEAPRIGVFWHDLYELNYVFVADQALENLLATTYSTSPADPRLSRFQPHLQGMVVWRFRHQVTLSHLAHSETDGLTARSPVLNVDGEVLGTTKELILRPLTTTYY